MKNMKKRKKPAFIAIMITAMIVLAGCDTDHDSALLGRWRGKDGGYFELWADGSFETNLTKDVEYFKSAKEKTSEESWSCSDGQLTLTWEHSVMCEYVYKDKGNGEWNVLTFAGNGDTFIGNGTTDYRKKSEGMVGQWDDGAFGYFIFEEDGTGTYAYLEGSSILNFKTIKIPIQWSSDDRHLYINYTNSSTYDYYLQSDGTLTMYFSDESVEYTKISNHD